MIQVQILLISSTEQHWGKIIEVSPLWELVPKAQLQIGHQAERHYVSVSTDVDDQLLSEAECVVDT